MHTSVNCHILQDIEDKIEEGDASVAALDYNEEFTRRLGIDTDEPFVNDLYFSYMLVLTAIQLATPRLLADCANGSIQAPELPSLLDHPIFKLPTTAVASDALVRHSSQSVPALWKIRMRSREMMRIMNCVQCGRCRLHGKITVMGVSTALQILVGNEACGGDPMALKRVELAALIATLSKFATAIDYIETKLNEGAV